MWKEWSPYSTASSFSRIYIFHLYMAHTSVIHYCGVLPSVKNSHSPVCQHHRTLYTKWEYCNHSTVSVSVSITKQRLCKGRLIPKIQSTKEVLIVLRWQLDFDREQKVTIFNWKIAINCLATSGSEAYPSGDEVTHVFALANSPSH